MQMKKNLHVIVLVATSCHMNFYSASAMQVESLAQELQSSINSTNMIQQQVSESLALLEDSIQETVEHIELVTNLFIICIGSALIVHIISRLMKMQQ